MSLLVISFPAHSSPWTQPTTRIVRELEKSPRRCALIGLPPTERPTTPRHSCGTLAEGAAARAATVRNSASMQLIRHGAR